MLRPKRIWIRQDDRIRFVAIEILLAPGQMHVAGAASLCAILKLFRRRSKAQREQGLIIIFLKVDGKVLFRMTRFFVKAQSMKYRAVVLYCWSYVIFPKYLLLLLKNFGY